MSFIGDFFSSGVGSVVDSIGGAIDSLVTSDEERLTLKNELVKIKAQAVLETKKIEAQYEQEITKRNDSDQKHGNFLTKSARPVFLYWIMGIITCMIFGGFFGVTVPPEYVTLITTLSVAAVTFFFGSKGMEAYKHGKIL